ncbi:MULTISPECIES: OmpA family protein [Burkholderia cepacia complex]|uniref:OmpA family protein n=1 Tax=Burkholderia cepacia complex TaxID=87882 RepID=UPI0012AEC6B6|nr:MULTISPECIES: OmpA family protein [Burkholderia cepacia complex]MBR7979870.1 OmpA family protein [Burkholderia cenocepacia]MBR7995042.1 OmpA family protein [Burkholderia cenocepacia]MDN7556797.1 OmpA family protein [Burkholderia orbicola]
MRIFITPLIVFVATSLILSANATAECQGPQNLPSRQFFVAFPANSHEISGSEATRIGQWVSTMNSRYPIQNWIDIIGSASKNEENPERLATKRASATAKLVIDDGLTNAPLQIKTQIYPASSTTGSTSETREVIVQVSPGCVDNCCTGH